MEVEGIFIQMLLIGEIRAASTRLTMLVRWHKLGKGDVGWTPDGTGASRRKNSEISAS
jgi:hypothetical protein